MRADDHIRLAFRQRAQCLLALFALDRAHQPHHAHAQRPQQTAGLVVMLLRQHLGGGHHGRLHAVFKRAVQQRKRDHGLAAAHVALHQPRHGPLALHVGQRLPQHALLRARQPVGQRVQKGLHHRQVGLQRPPRARPPVQARHADAHQQQVVKRQPPQRRRQLLPVPREMDAVHRLRISGQCKPRAQALGQRIGQRFARAFPRLPHQFFIDSRRHLPHGRIHRPDAVRRYGRHLRALHAQLSPAARRHPHEKERRADLQRAPAVGLVEPHALHLARLVKHRSGGQRHAVHPRSGGLFHARGKHRPLPRAQLIHLGAVVVVDVVPGKAPQQLFRLGQARFMQRLQPHLAHALELLNAQCAPPPSLNGKRLPKSAWTAVDDSG